MLKRLFGAFVLALFAAVPVLSAQPEGQAMDAPAMMAGSESVTTPEHEGPATATDKIVERFMQLDTDEDPEMAGTVSFEEYLSMVLERAQARFESMDADGDGEVTPEEYREFWQSRKAMWYRLKR